MTHSPPLLLQFEGTNIAKFSKILKKLVFLLSTLSLTYKIIKTKNSPLSSLNSTHLRQKNIENPNFFLKNAFSPAHYKCINSRRCQNQILQTLKEKMRRKDYPQKRQRKRKFVCAQTCKKEKAKRDYGWRANHRVQELKISIAYIFHPRIFPFLSLLLLFCFLLPFSSASSSCRLAFPPLLSAAVPE